MPEAIPWVAWHTDWQGEDSQVGSGQAETASEIDEAPALRVVPIAVCTCLLALVLLSAAVGFGQRFLQLCPSCPQDNS